MYPGFANHIMFGTRIYEIIDLLILFNTLINKGETVLPDNCIVIGPVDYQ